MAGSDDATRNRKPGFDVKTERGRVLIGCGVLVLAALVAYHNSFSGPFVFDSDLAITDNPSIRHLWPIWTALHPPAGGSPVSGRPLANLSFALNYALGGTDVRGYHALDLVLHILAGLTLFGVLRRTLGAPPGWPAQGAPAGGVWLPDTAALGVAVIWTVRADHRPAAEPSSVPMISTVQPTAVTEPS